MTPRPYLGRSFTQFFDHAHYEQRLAQLVAELAHHQTRGTHIGSRPFGFGQTIFETSPLSRKAACGILRRYFDDLYETARGANEECWLDDTPYNLVHAPELLELFPDMRFVHIYRDPRDVLASSLTFGWGGDSLLATARRLSDLYDRWRDACAKLPADRYFSLALEELAACPRRELVKLCNHLNLAFEEHLLDIPLDRVHAGRWKRDLRPVDLAQATELLSPHIQHFGYAHT